jgi:Aspartyl/Asparaginyl beta-hydroxylase
MRHFELIATGVDVSGVLAELEAAPHLWNAHRRRKDADGTPHAGMDDIWVRYNDCTHAQATDDWTGFNDAHVPVWYPAWDALPNLKPIVFGLMARVEGEMIGGVLITRIPPGGRIDPHTDAGWHVEYYDKFYLSLQSAPGAKFGCDHDGVIEELDPKPGEIWLFDNRKMHWVQNDSTEDRVTLIVCIRTAKDKI